MSDAQAPRSAPTSSWADDSDDSDAEAEFARKLAVPENMSPRAAGKTPGSAHADTGAGGGLKIKGKDGEESQPKPSQEDQPVASLLSRISGLSTDPTPSPQTSVPSPQTPAAAAAASPSRTRPQAQVANNLFGKALAGVKSDRAPPSGPAATTSAAPVSAPAKETALTASSSASTKAPVPAPPASAGSSKGKELIPETSEDKEKGKMTYNFMDDPQGKFASPGRSRDNGWGARAASNTGGGGAEPDDGGWGSGNTGGNGQDVQIGSEKGNDSMRKGNDMLEADMRSDGGESGLISNDFQVEVKLADQQADASSPLYSAKTFEELKLHETLQKGIYGVGFKKPSKIQERALPLLLAHPPRNLIGQSQSGTGKTAAFALNLLSRLSPDMMTPQAIVLCPSRELARQTQKVVDDIGQFTNIKTFLAVPQSWSRNQAITKQILIGTPGTIIDMLGRGTRIFDPKHIRILVLDEADQMVHMQGMGDSSFRIKRMLPGGVQNILFSATFPDEVRRFAADFAPEANQIYLKKEDVTVEAITQLYLECDGEATKFEALSALYDVMTIGQSIVFCQRRSTADEIAERLRGEGHSVAALHGEKENKDRDDVLDGFRDGKTKVLITTNVIARGIDIQQVNMVVNYDIPLLGPEGGFKADVETYIHRIGRTGRFGRKGCSVTFAHDSRSKDDVELIMRETARPMKKIDVNRSTDLEQLEKALKAALKKA